MNNSIYLKKLIGKTFNELSETSSDFITQLNINQNNLLIGGNTDYTLNALNAFNDNNLDLALYILKDHFEDLCCAKQDHNGNTILHHLVLNSENHQCVDLIKKLLKNNNNINVQNNNGETPMLIAVLNDNNNVAEIFGEAGADLSIKDNRGNYIKDETDNSDLSFVFMTTTPAKMSSTIQTDIDNNLDSDAFFGKLLNPNKKSSSNNIYQNIIRSKLDKPNNNTESNTDKYIKSLSEKYGSKSSATSDDFSATSPLKTVNNELSSNTSENSLDVNSFIKQNLIDEPTSKSNTELSSKTSVTSPLNTSVDNNSILKEKLINESTTDKSMTTGTDESKTVDTDELISAIDAIKKGQIGGKLSNKQKIIGSRKLILDSEESDDNSESSLSNKNLDYNLLYNSDSEYGNKKSMHSELSRMLQRQRDDLHHQVLDMIMSMLTAGTIEQDSKSIPASESNAKLIKAYVYRKIAENNPQLNGLDKIILFKKMSEQEIINIIKNMPDLEDLEKDIQKHIQQKKDNRPPKDSKESKKSKNSKNLDSSDLENIKPKKESKKETKKETKKESKKETKKKSKK